MPVTRFSEFVIVADLIAMDRTIADVVFKSDLRQHLRPLAGKSFANVQDRRTDFILVVERFLALNSFPFRQVKHLCQSLVRQSHLSRPFTRRPDNSDSLL
jgi:hypothetical protein